MTDSTTTTTATTAAATPIGCKVRGLPAGKGAVGEDRGIGNGGRGSEWGLRGERRWGEAIVRRVEEARVQL